MEGRARIPPDVLAYAADAAGEVAGAHGLADRRGPSRPELARALQRRFREYVQRMVDLEPASVDVVLDRIAAPR
jgi:hypothetical protein